jgi:hypothetical protein
MDLSINPPNEEEDCCRAEDPGSYPHKRTPLHWNFYRPAEMNLRRTPCEFCQANHEEENGKS